jgi:serine/threonine-protein kinase
MLTGRPPFRGETATETERQVVADDPVPPVRLNPKVPRDLETICLKCLQKDPARRYFSAGALADDVRRFVEGRPIQARRSSWAVRSWRWIRRKPAEAALVTAAAAVALMALGGGLWLERQRAELRTEKARKEGRASQAVEAALEKAAALQREGRWSEARTAFQGAQGLVDAAAVEGLAERVRQARADVSMVVELEEIRLRFSDGRQSQATASLSPEKMYSEAFRNYGIPVMTLDRAEAAARVRDSAIRPTLLAFLHDWLHWVSDEKRARLRDVLDRADDDDWRRAFRDALVDRDADKLNALAHAPGASGQPPVIVSGLVGAMLGDKHKHQALVLLREAQERHPGDFWINYLLGKILSQERPQEAAGYFPAAVAIRPTSDQAYMMLGRALIDTGDADGALAAFHQSVALDPNYAVAKDLAWTLAPRGGLEEARTAWEKFLDRDPPDHDSWYGYAQLCLFLGNEDAYRRARKALLKRFGDTTSDWIVAERTSLACLLLPNASDELHRAIRLADLASGAAESSTGRGNVYLRFLKGLALVRDGRHKEAIPLLREAAEQLPNRAGPRLAQAMAEFHSALTTEARKSLAAAVRAYNWSDPPAASQRDYPTLWVNHVLRREAEALILANLPAFLQGNYQPQDNDERLALLGICQFRGLARASAGLFADAFAADPGLADLLNQECLGRALQGAEGPPDPTEAFKAACRYRAASCSALAGCGLGKDGYKLSEAERTHWRKQARAWLQADLVEWTKMLDSDSPVAQNVAKRMLTNWEADPDLAGLRELRALDELSPDERKDCLALWQAVASPLKRAREGK